VDLLAKVLVYSPRERLQPIDAMIHSYFDDIRNENCSKFDQKTLNALFETSDGSNFMKKTNFLYKNRRKKVLWRKNGSVDPEMV